jgi:hypothetical protein
VSFFLPAESFPPLSNLFQQHGVVCVGSEKALASFISLLGGHGGSFGDTACLDRCVGLPRDIKWRRKTVHTQVSGKAQLLGVSWRVGLTPMRTAKEMLHQTDFLCVGYPWV